MTDDINSVSMWLEWPPQPEHQDPSKYHRIIPPEWKAEINGELADWKEAARIIAILRKRGDMPKSCLQRWIESAPEAFETVMDIQKFNKRLREEDDNGDDN